MVTKKSRNVRIGNKLDSLLLNMSKRNEVTYIKAGDDIADLISRLKYKNKIKKRIVEEIEFWKWIRKVILRVWFM